MRRVINANGNRHRFTGSDQPPISFSGLQSRIQGYLRGRSPNPAGLANNEIEKFREDFLDNFPEMGPAVTNTKIMRRLMTAAAADRQKRQNGRSRKPRHYLALS
jgi:hypothetical protein